MINRITKQKQEPQEPKEDLWPEDSKCNTARLAGRLAARYGFTDEEKNRPATNKVDWLIGHYEEKRNLRRLNNYFPSA